jgi:hypothetical protein
MRENSRVYAGSVHDAVSLKNLERARADAKVTALAPGPVNFNFTAFHQLSP